MGSKRINENENRPYMVHKIEELIARTHCKIYQSNKDCFVWAWYTE